ncbi:alpha/beta hydrolase domain-containing protein [Trametes meyenii]|nr:alpha/beta hydrolase domain-containing protein [Trametes meyenii]
MDVVASLNETSIPVVLPPTTEAFAKLLESHRSEIESIPRKTFRYGEAERHNLDVYYPPTGAVSAGNTPTLFFTYGGGFVRGTRQFPPPMDLVYANVGAFFAKRGILTVIPDYRLVPDVKFPQPIEDLRDALTWFLANPTTVSDAAPPALSLSLSSSLVSPSIFFMGHSAGGNYLTSLYLLPSVLPLDSPIRAATRGIIPQGGAFRFDLDRPMTAPGVLEQLYGSSEQALAHQPLSLLEGADEALVEGWPESFFMISELDPPPLIEASDLFVKTLEGKLGKGVKYEVMKGHNHISPHWALGTGQGEEWAEHVAEWIKSKV